MRSTYQIHLMDGLSESKKPTVQNVIVAGFSIIRLASMDYPLMVSASDVMMQL